MINKVTAEVTAEVTIMVPPPRPQALTYLVVCPGFHPPALTDRAIAQLALPPSIQPIIIPTDRYLPCDPLGIDRHLRHYFASPSRPGHVPHPSRNLRDPRDPRDPGDPRNSIRPRLSFLGFSAGTVGALGAAWLWRDRARVEAIILCDGWGVPVLPVWAQETRGETGRGTRRGAEWGTNPVIYRMSHDRWTHETWSRLGIATPSFIATPEVEHLTLWSQPDRVWGKAVDATGQVIGRGVSVDGEAGDLGDLGDLGETCTMSAAAYIHQCLRAGAAAV